VIIVPCGITASMEDTDRIALIGSCEEFEAALKAAGIRVRGDYRVNYSPGWKFNHWELKVRNIYVFQYSMFSITQWNTFKMMIN
jgi:Prolyl-tRNA synthetase